MYICMRTTIDLPDDIHRIVVLIARDRGTTLSEAVSYLLRRAIEPPRSPTVSTSPRTGLPVISFGYPMTSEDLWALEDD